MIKWPKELVLDMGLLRDTSKFHFLNVLSIFYRFWLADRSEPSIIRVIQT